MYSLDLILHVIHYYKHSNVSLRTIANQLCLSKSSISRWVNKYDRDEINSNNENISDDINVNNKNEIIQRILLFLKNSLNQNPFQTLEIIKENMKRKLNIFISTKTISKYLKIIGYRKKKVVKRFYNKRLRDHINDRKIFIRKIRKINPNDILCIDETYINEKIYSEYGYTSKKRLTRYYKINGKHNKQSLIMCISNKKVIKYEIHKRKGINTDIYYNFISDMVKNVTNKYILMDNVAFHRSKKITDLINKSGNKVLFIPSYSPDCNPIEEVFSSMKSYLRKYINPINIDIKVPKIIGKWIRTVDTFDNYYKNSFG